MQRQISIGKIILEMQMCKYGAFINCEVYFRSISMHCFFSGSDEFQGCNV